MMEVLHSGCSTAGGEGDVEEECIWKERISYKIIGLHSGCSMAGGEGDVEVVVYKEGENKLQDSNNNNNSSNNILY